MKAKRVASGSCGNGCRRNNLPNMTSINISTSLAAIAESGIGYTMAQVLTSMS
jgi:hypothetical protein